jgi:nucleoside-diphosphate-sugar epimerase
VKILVTGGAGYVGSVLAPLLLERGHAVRVLDTLQHGGAPLLGVWAHPSFEFLRGDVRDRERVAEAVRGVDAVVHLAAIVGDPACARDKDTARSVNAGGSLLVLEEARRAGVSRFVFASTCSNYGRMKDASGYVTEDSELAPVSLYAETKVGFEKTLLGLPTANGFSATPLRFATVFGVSPRMRFDLTVNEFTMEMLTKKRLVVFGEQFWRPYIHVRDAARAIEGVLTAPAPKVAGRVFNVGATDQNYQKQQLVDLIQPQAPDALVEYVHRDEDPRDYRVSFARVADELGFRTSRSVPDGIREVADLVRSGAITDFESPRYRN